MKNHSIYILDIPFTSKNKAELVAELKDSLSSETKQQLFLATPNSEMLLESEKNKDLQNILKNTDYNIPDGMGILWAAHFLWWTRNDYSKLKIILKGILSLFKLLFNPKAIRNQFKDRLSGTDLMKEICTNPALSIYPIFLLGGGDGIAEKATKNLQSFNLNLKIAGTYSGSPDDEENLTLINQSQATILFVAFGSPKQELWIKNNLSKLSSVKLAIGVGGAFDFFAGKRKRAPLFMQKLGLEWLFRLIQEPLRIKRILNATVKFPLYFMKYQIQKKKLAKSYP